VKKLIQEKEVREAFLAFLHHCCTTKEKGAYVYKT